MISTPSARMPVISETFLIKDDHHGWKKTGYLNGALVIELLQSFDEAVRISLEPVQWHPVHEEGQ